MQSSALIFGSARPALSAPRFAVVAVAVAWMFGVPATDSRAEVLRAGGTGAASVMLQRVGAAFTAQNHDTTLEVLPGLGSAGAIAAVADGAIDFAVAGRPLKPEEANKGLAAVVLARTPFGLASSYPHPGNIASDDVAALFLNPASAWSDGTPVRVILRPKSEADAANLGAAFPEMVAAIEQLRLRPEIPLAVTDQDNLRIAQQYRGSLTAVTLTQMVTEQPRLTFLTIDGVEPTLDNFERGSYPFGKNFHFVYPVRNSPALQRFLAFLRSPEAEKILRDTGSLAVRP